MRDEMIFILRLPSVRFVSTVEHAGCAESLCSLLRVVPRPPGVWPSHALPLAPLLLRIIVRISEEAKQRPSLWERLPVSSLLDAAVLYRAHPGVLKVLEGATRYPAHAQAFTLIPQALARIKETSLILREAALNELECAAQAPSLASLWSGLLPAIPELAQGLRGDLAHTLSVRLALSVLSVLPPEDWLKTLKGFLGSSLRRALTTTQKALSQYEASEDYLFNSPIFLL